MNGRGRGLAVATMAAVLASLGPRPAAVADDLPLLTPAPLPMAIRDGRVAAIAVRAVPFAAGRGEPTPAVAAALDRLAAEAATDCFLTAQAVGHVRPGVEADGGDAMALQELARARAERVRAALVAAGLPEDAIAAVSDYRFGLREPRVTLWLFSLARGVDCQGKPPGRRGAATPPPEERPATAAAAPSARPPPASARADALATAEIAFASGSSFFPSGAEQTLQRLVDALAKNRGYRFELVAGVDDAPVKAGDPAESARYNRWLSDRRLARVGEWIEGHAEIRDLSVTRDVREGDRSPRVTIRVLPSAAAAR